MRHLVFGIILLLLCTACDGLEPFERDNPRDPGGERYVPLVEHLRFDFFDRVEPRQDRFGEVRSIALHWRDRSEREDGFFVARTRAEGGLFRRIGVVDENDTTAYDAPEQHGKYVYRVCTHRGFDRVECAADTLDVSGVLPLPYRHSVEADSRIAALNSNDIAVHSEVHSFRIFSRKQFSWFDSTAPGIGDVQVLVSIGGRRLVAVGTEALRVYNQDWGWRERVRPGLEEWATVEGASVQAERMFGTTDSVLVSGRTSKGPFAGVFEANPRHFQFVADPSFAPTALVSLSTGHVLGVGHDLLLYEPTEDVWQTHPTDSDLSGAEVARLADGRAVIVSDTRRVFTYDASADELVQKGRLPQGASTFLRRVSDTEMMVGVEVQEVEGSPGFGHACTPLLFDVDESGIESGREFRCSESVFSASARHQSLSSGTEFVIGTRGASLLNVDRLVDRD